MIATAIILFPFGEQTNAPRSALSAIFFANFVITECHTGGYFDLPGAANPLLNTWSLLVKDQVYLAFPAVIDFIWHLSGRTATFKQVPFFFISGIIVIFFELAVAGSFGWFFNGADLILGFYSPFIRAWEFAVGALPSLAITRVTPSYSS